MWGLGGAGSVIVAVMVQADWGCSSRSEFVSFCMGHPLLNDKYTVIFWCVYLSPCSNCIAHYTQPETRCPMCFENRYLQLPNA